MASRDHLRASDADREQTAERLRRATGEGRLATHELDERLGAALRARTYGELDKVVADLPGGRVAHPERARSTALALGRPALAVAILVPLVMAVVFLVTGVVAVWMVWAVLGWWFFGRHGRCRGALYGPRTHRHDHGIDRDHDFDRGRAGRGRAGAAPGSWV